MNLAAVDAVKDILKHHQAVVEDLKGLLFTKDLRIAALEKELRELTNRLNGDSK